MSSAIPVELSEQITYVAIGRLLPNTSNPRRDLREMDDLAASVRDKGILVPLVVEVVGGNYRLIAGHRRLAAAKLAGLARVPCIVRRYSDDDRLDAMLIDNVQRNDLDPIEEAQAYQKLVDRGLRQKEIARRVGKSEAHVSKRLQLLYLPIADRRAISKGTLPMTEALGYMPGVVKRDTCRTCGRKLPAKKAG